MNYSILYKKYLTNTIINADLSGEGDDPFADGKLTFDTQGNYRSAASNTEGDVFEFLKKLYPGLTDFGARRILQTDTQLSIREMFRIEEAIEQFRKEDRRFKIGVERLGVSEPFLKQHPIYMERVGFRFNVITSLSPNGEPLSLSSFTERDPLPSTIGIPRILKPVTDRVWLVENPVLAIWIESLTKETAMCWPEKESLATYNFADIFKNREVIVLHGEMDYVYNRSFYPLQHQIRSAVKSFSIIKLTSLTGKLNEYEWTKKPDNRAQLLKIANSNGYKPPMSRAIYESCNRTTEDRAMLFAQGHQRGYLFYGLNDGSIVQSHPVDISTVRQTEINYKLKIQMPERYLSEIKLSSNMVISICESIDQLNSASTFRQIRELLQEHVYFENKHSATLMTLWIMSTYVHQIFNAFPYIHVKAPLGSGKTTLLELVEHLSFNGKMASKITHAAMMNSVNDLQCTLCLDEFEKKTVGQGAASTQILNSGYKRNGQYLKMNGDNANGLKLYSPKLYASIDEIKSESLESRTLRVDMVKAPMNTTLKDLDLQDNGIQKRIRAAVESCYALGLYDHQKIEYLQCTISKKISLPSGIGITGRRKELIEPLLVMAILVDHTDNMNQAEDPVNAESALYSQIQEMFYPDFKEDIRRKKLFANQLKSWGNNLAGYPIKKVGENYLISNSLWDDTAILTEFDDKKLNFYNWVKAMESRITIEPNIWMKSKNHSCLSLPEDLIIDNSPISEWLSKKPADSAQKQ